MDLVQTDYKLITEHLLRNYTRKELEDQGFLDRQFDKELRTQLARKDMGFFCRFYLHEHFSKPPAKVHWTLFAEVKKLIETPGRQHMVLVLPRGWAKTTIATLAVPLWCVMFNLKKHIGIVSDSQDQAKDQLQTLKSELEHNERLREDFGNLVGKNIWQMMDIETASHIRIRAFGTGQKIRGRKHGKDRFDLLLLDDLENLKAVNSQAAREALHRFVYGSVMKAGWTDTTIIAMGNFLHWDCLLMNMVKNPMFKSIVFKAMVSWPDNMDMWDHWRDLITNLDDPQKNETAKAYFEAHKEEMLQGAESSWPDAFSVYDLMMMRVSDGEASFAMELQNEPIDPTRRFFKSWGIYRRARKLEDTWLVPAANQPAVRLKDCAIFAFTDPSLGKTARADYSAIIILAKAPTRQQFVLEADIKRRPLDQLIKDQIKYAKKYKITRWGIESNAFQALFTTDSARASMQSGVYMPIAPVNQIANKTARIQTLQPDLENRYILLPENGAKLLKQQLERWKPSSTGNDDGPDALEGARNLAREWEPLDVVEIVQGDIHQFNKHEHDRGTEQYDPWDEADKLADERIREYRLAQRDAIMNELEGEEREAALAKLPVLEEKPEVFVPKMVY